LLLAVVALLTGGWPVVGSAVMGAADVLVFFALGALIDAMALRRAEPMSGVVILGSFAVRLALLTIVATMLARSSLIASVEWFGVGVVIAAMAWVVGMIVGHATGRWPIYDAAGVMA